MNTFSDSSALVLVVQSVKAMLLAAGIVVSMYALVRYWGMPVKAK